jgi:aryl-alcohol dehydrogenase-like predicted oxidoreductase
LFLEATASVLLPRHRDYDRDTPEDFQEADFFFNCLKLIPKKMKLGLGTVQFGLPYGVTNTVGQVNPSQAQAITQRAYAAGIDTLDTAMAYGSSETVLGDIGVRPWRVVTKLPDVPEHCDDISSWVNAQVEASLARLKLGRVHALLLHRPTQLLEDIGPELNAALQTLKGNGIVDKIGVSVYGTAELEALFGRYTFDLVQAPLNIVDRTLVDSGWAQRLKNEGIEIHTRSAFLQGLLLVPHTKRPTKFNRWEYIWTEWDRWLEATGLTPLQACLRWTNTLGAIDKVIVGVESVTQLDQILAAHEGPLPSLPQFRPLHDDRLINPATWNQL